MSVSTFTVGPRNAILATGPSLPLILLDSGSTSIQNITNGAATAQLTFVSDGSMSYIGVGGSGFPAWLDNVTAGNGADFELMYDGYLGSGLSVTGGLAQSVWTPLGASVSFTLLQPGQITGSKTASFKVHIRSIDLSQPIEFRNMSLYAENLGGGF